MVNYEVEVIIDLVELSNVFILHLSTGDTLAAGTFLLRETHLVDHYIVNVDFKLRELNSQTLSLIETQELWNANSNESCLFGVLELVVHLNDLLLHHIEGVKKFLLHVFPSWALCTTAKHPAELTNHPTELLLHLYHLQEGLIKNVWEVQQPERVSRGRCIEDDKLELVGIKGFYDLSEARRLVDSRH